MPQPCGLSIFGLHSFVFKSIPKAIVVIEPTILESVQGTKVRLKNPQDASVGFASFVTFTQHYSAINQDVLVAGRSCCSA